MSQLNSSAARPRKVSSKPLYPTVLAIGLLLGLAACGGNVDDSSPNGEQTDARADSVNGHAGSSGSAGTGGSAGTDIGPSGAAPNDFDSGPDATGNAGSGGNAGGSAGYAGDPNPSGEIADPFDGGSAGSGGNAGSAGYAGEPNPGGDIAEPFDAGSPIDAGAAADANPGDAESAGFAASAFTDSAIKLP